MSCSSFLRIRLYTSVVCPALSVSHPLDILCTPFNTFFRYQPGEIGYALAFSGAAGALVQVFVFPVLQRRFNNVPLYRILMLLWPILFAILPFLGILARWSAPPEALSEAAATIPIGADIDFADVATEEGARYAFAAGPLLWTGIGVALAVLRCAHMCYSCVLASCC